MSENHDLLEKKLVEPRKAIVTAAADMQCIICGGRPCYLLATTAIATMYETLIYNEDSTSVRHYSQSLEKIQECLLRHVEVAKEMWQEYSKHNRPKEDSNGYGNGNGIVAITQLEARNGDPPALN